MAVGLVLFAMVVHAIIVNQHFQWNVVWQYFHARAILDGMYLTLELTFITLGLAFVLGALMAVARTSASTILNVVSWLFVWFFRGTPLLVQLIFWYNLASLYPTLSLGVPFGPAFVSGASNDLITAFSAAVIAFALNQGAYMCEIIRAGMLAVDEGQRDAAAMLGLSRFQTLQKVIAPQAMRVILPSVGNLLIDLLKSTALISVLSLPELLYSAQLIYSQNFLTIPVLLAATIWYLIITTLLTIVQYYIERRYARGSARNMPLTPWQKTKKKARRVAGMAKSIEIRTLESTS